MSNITTITFENTTIKQDADGRYCLNHLHKAAGGKRTHQPSNFFRNAQTDGLINELRKDPDLRLEPVKVVHGGAYRGTYVVEELVYAYAIWISPKFHLKVIEFFDRGVTQGVAVADHAVADVLADPMKYLPAILAQAEILQAKLAVAARKAAVLNEAVPEKSSLWVTSCRLGER